MTVKKSKSIMSKPENNIILYQDENGVTRVNVRFSDEDLWLTQFQVAEIYDTTKQNISQHIKNILSDGELSENSVVKKFFTTASDGKEYKIVHYNLDMIIAIGYFVANKIYFPTYKKFLLVQKKNIEDGEK